MAREKIRNIFPFSRKHNFGSYFNNIFVHLTWNTLFRNVSIYFLKKEKNNCIKVGDQVFREQIWALMPALKIIMFTVRKTCKNSQKNLVSFYFP